MRLYVSRSVLCIGAGVMIAALPLPATAEEFDCSFFEEQAQDRLETDFSVRLREACRALAAYRAAVLAESVRYAFGDDAVAPTVEGNVHRSRWLETGHVLPEMTRYMLAREIGVFDVIEELP